MAYEERDMSGVLFAEQKKNATQPDWSGYIKIDGKKYRIAGWDKTGQKKRISIKVCEFDR